MSNRLRARNVPAIQGHLPGGPVRDKAGSCLPCPGDPRSPEAWLSCRAPVTSPLTSPGPSWCNLTARSAVSPGLGSLCSNTTHPQARRPAASVHLSGRRQARKRPTVARRWEAPTRLSAPELWSAQQPPCTPARHSPQLGSGQPGPPQASPPCGPLVFSPLGTGNSYRPLFNPQRVEDFKNGSHEDRASQGPNPVP